MIPQSSNPDDRAVIQFIMEAFDSLAMKIPGMSKYRAEMDITKEWTFLDTACVAPISNRARNALLNIASEMASQGPADLEKWTRTQNKTRILASKMINCDPHEIAFVKNTSEGISFVANGFPFQSGDNIVITGIEYPANRYPWLDLERKGVSVTPVPAGNGRVPTDLLLSAVTEKTKLLSISSVQFSSGFRHDLKAIGEFCKSRGIFFFVDMIQGIGVLDMDVRNFNIDAASADGHKWLVSPEGIGIFYISKDAQKIIRPTELGWFNFIDPLNFLDYNQTFKNDATRYEAGSPNTIGIFALNASLGLLLEIGIKNIEEYVLELSGHLCEKLLHKGYILYSSRKEDEKSPIVVFYADGLDSEIIHKELERQKIKTTCRNGRIRAAVHFFNNEDDIDKLVEALPELKG